MIDIGFRSGLAIAISVTGASLLAYILYRRTTPTIPRRLRLILGSLRWIAAFIILLLVTDPALTWLRTEQRKPVITFLVDDSRSMVYPDSAVKLDRVRPSLSEDIFERLGEKAEIRIFTFSDATGEIAAEEIQHLEPRGARTDLVAGIKSALEVLDARPSALVVVSDGGINFGDDAVHFASSLRIPVSVVSLAQDEATPDISIDRIETSGVAYANSDVPVWINLSGRNGEEIGAELTISDSTGTVLTREVMIPATGAQTRIMTNVKAGEIGTHAFKATISPFEGEAVKANNSAAFSLRVIKGKIRVCLVAPQPSWDFAFARRTLEADPNIDVSVMFTKDNLRDIDIEGVVGGLRNVIGELDILIVFKGAMLGGDYDLAAEFVRGGGGMLFISGEPTSRAFSEMGPFVLSSNEAGDPALYGASLTDAGRDHEITKVEIGGYDASWGSLPPLPVSPAVTGATDESTVLLSGVSGNEVVPLLALKRYGAGRVVGFSAFDLWRWDLVPKGFGIETSAFSELLLSSVGWLTEREEVRKLSVSTSKNTYFWGEPVDLFARVVDENLKPVSDAVVSGRINSDSTAETVSSFDLAERGGGSHYHRLDLLPPGRYTARITARIGGEPFAEETARFTIDERGLEDSGFDGDIGVLGDLAATSGGAVYGIDEVRRLVDDLNPGSVVTRNTSELRLKLSLGSFVILVGLLGVEWFIRKRRMLL